MTGPRLSVIVPVFNEERRIGRSAAALVRWLRVRGGAWELIIVDDGSSDSTPSILAGMARGNPRVRLIRHARNRGKGAAVRTGMAAARGRHVVFMDADLSTAPDQIPAALRQLEAGWDVAIGSRALPRSRLPVPQPFLRRISGRAFNASVRTLLTLPFADTQCGFKAFTARASRLLARLGRVNGFDFDVELLLLARREGLRVVEFPITWSDRAHSTVRLFRHSIRMFGTLLALRRKFRNSVEFHPVLALPLILFSVLFAVTGQIMMKYGALRLPAGGLGPAFIEAIARNPFVWAGISCYGISAVTWLVALAKVDLSFAFPMLSLGFVATALYSWAAFGERLAAARIAGIGLVVLGVFLIAASGKARGAAEAQG